MVFALIILISICASCHYDLRVTATLFMADDISPTTKQVDLVSIFFFYDVHAQTKSHVHEFVGMNVTDFHLSIYFVLLLPLVRCCWKTVYLRFWNGCFCLLAHHVMSMWVLFDYHMICLLIGLVPFCRATK